MRKIVTAALIAAVAVPAALPAAASAQARPYPYDRELQRDRQDIRREQGQLDRAYARGDWREVRDQRGDVREARREYREDLRDRQWGRNDWRGWRDRNRTLYARGTWRAPFAYQAFRPGARIAPAYYGPRYVIADPWRYRLPPARGYARWVRHYDDAVLIDYRRGVVIDVIRGFYW